MYQGLRREKMRETECGIFCLSYVMLSVRTSPPLLSSRRYITLHDAVFGV